MLTIFSIPKPFTGHIGVIQRNAIHSWARLCPPCEVILCGNESGIQEIVDELEVTWLPDIECNEYGTPLLNSAFAQVAQTSRYSTLCYVNADIILLPEFLTAIQRITNHQALISGRRWNVDITELINFENPNWQADLNQVLETGGAIGALTQLDYFVFPKQSELVHLPPFAVGRPTWDNWFVFRARQLGMPVIDITEAVKVIHQNHDYNHVPKRRGKSWEGPEGDRNFQLTGGWEQIYTLADATHILTLKHLIPALSRWRYWSRLWERKAPKWFPKEKQIKWWFNVFRNRLNSLISPAK